MLGFALLVLAGVASSLLARRFGAPLLLVFLLLGVALGVDGPGGIRFADTHFTYLVGSLCLAIILFDGGLRTRAQQVSGSVVPAVVLASVGVLITAGPTREPIDPVRYISNRSSGKMGFALAEEARDRGASVTIVSGPASAAPPSGCKIVPVETAQQMYDRVMENLDAAQIVVMAAAVADYRPASPAPRKIKKDDRPAPAVELEPTQDILKAVGASKGSRILVGFAAETENLQANAERKLRGKNCDLLVANLVGAGLAFDTDDNQGLILSASGDVVEISRMSKRQMAGRVFDAVLRTSRATIA